MLRDGLNHVLCRGRRDVIRKRAPEFHRWQGHGVAMLPIFRAQVRVDSRTDHAVVAKLVADAVQGFNRQQLAALQRMGVL